MICCYQTFYSLLFYCQLSECILINLTNQINFHNCCSAVNRATVKKKIPVWWALSCHLRILHTNLLIGQIKQTPSDSCQDVKNKSKLCLYDSNMIWCICVVPEKIHTSHGRFSDLNLPLLSNSCLALYFPLNNHVWDPPNPLGIFSNPPCGGYGYFLELQNNDADSIAVSFCWIINI